MLKRVFKAFHYRDFRVLWIGACTSSIGTWMQEIAQNWLVLELTKSPFLLGIDAFLGDIPIFLFSWLSKKEPLWLPDEGKRKLYARSLIIGSILLAILIAQLHPAA